MARKGKQAYISSTFEGSATKVPAPHIARVVLARPEQRNAQDRKMLYEIDRSFRIAVADNDLKSSSSRPTVSSFLVRP
jgi:enoyl-CoA hydratase/carnithine racemase